MKPVQIFAQLVSAVVAVLGAAGYVLVLGAIIFWIRLHQAGFDEAVPISLASRSELISIGAQTIALWLVLALGIVALVVRLASRSLTKQDVVADIALGLSLTVITLAALQRQTLWITIVLAVIPGWILLRLTLAAWHVRPPLAVWSAALLPALVGVTIAAATNYLSIPGNTGVATSFAAWGVLVAVVLFAPRLRVDQQFAAQNAAAIKVLQARLAGNTPGSPLGGTGAGDDPLIAMLGSRLSSSRIRLWLGLLGVGMTVLLLLGVVAVLSQFSPTRLFREGFVSLNTGRCVSGTYLARDNDEIVLGDQQRFYLHDRKVKTRARKLNREVIIPEREVLELQVSDPVGVGVKLSTRTCSPTAVVTPDGSSPEPFRGPPGAPGPAGAQGKQGPAGARGGEGLTGATGAQGRTGAKGARGRTGAKGAEDAEDP